MIVALKVVTDLYDKPNKKGVSKLLKRNAIYLRQFETTMITSEQILNKNGSVNRKHCMIKEGDQYYKVSHKFEEIQRLTERAIVKGFRND